MLCKAVICAFSFNVTFKPWGLIQLVQPIKLPVTVPRAMFWSIALIMHTFLLNKCLIFELSLRPMFKGLRMCPWRSFSPLISQGPWLQPLGRSLAFPKQWQVKWSTKSQSSPKALSTNAAPLILTYTYLHTKTQTNQCLQHAYLLSYKINKTK